MKRRSVIGLVGVGVIGVIGVLAWTSVDPPFVEPGPVTFAMVRGTLERLSTGTDPTSDPARKRDAAIRAMLDDAIDHPEDPASAGAWAWLRYQDQRHLAVEIVVDGVQGRILRALASPGGQDPYLVRVLHAPPVPKPVRSAVAVEPQNESAINDFAARGGHILPYFEKVLSTVQPGIAMQGLWRSGHGSPEDGTRPPALRLLRSREWSLPRLDPPTALAVQADAERAQHALVADLLGLEPVLAAVHHPWEVLDRRAQAAARTRARSIAAEVSERAEVGLPDVLSVDINCPRLVSPYPMHPDSPLGDDILRPDGCLSSAVAGLGRFAAIYADAGVSDRTLFGLWSLGFPRISWTVDPTTLAPNWSDPTKTADTLHRLGPALRMLATGEGTNSADEAHVLVQGLRDGKIEAAHLTREGDRVRYQALAGDDVLDLQGRSPWGAMPQSSEPCIAASASDKPADWCTEADWRAKDWTTPLPHIIGPLVHLYDGDPAGGVVLFPAEGVAFDGGVRVAPSTYAERDAFVGIWGAPVDPNALQVASAETTAVPDALYTWVIGPGAPPEPGWTPDLTLASTLIGAPQPP